MEKDFIYYNIITIKWGESTHFPGRNDPGQTGNGGEMTRIPEFSCTTRCELMLLISTTGTCVESKICSLHLKVVFLGMLDISALGQIGTRL